MIDHASCQVCDRRALEPITGYEALPRVTSDSKPWPAGGKLALCNGCGAIQKLPNAAWLDEIDRIYRDYDLYHLSSGAEQLIFTDPLNPVARSRLLVDYVVQKASLRAAGRLIDVGCGNGAALANFSQALPAWQLYGSELSDKAGVALRKLPNFVELYTGPFGKIGRRFSLVSMIHSLEHVTTPRATLIDARDILEPEGTLFVEVPDVETSPFDVLVADHLMHFSRATLVHLAASAGFGVSAIDNRVVSKEITLLAHVGEAGPAHADPNAGREIARATIAWLSKVVAAVAALAAAGPFAIFGTAIAGMALYGRFCDRVSLFVDEDRARVGQVYDGKPILAPDDVPVGTTVFLAMPRETAERIAARLAQRTNLRFVLPPPLPAVRH